MATIIMMTTAAAMIRVGDIVVLEGWNETLNVFEPSDIHPFGPLTMSCTFQAPIPMSALTIYEYQFHCPESTVDELNAYPSL
jgi:hypothetical protein